ncbi:MAG: efflux RND transporter periplasmic adaptor subunit [candidate division KSB1 bacterium]|nr:efflux RND transporter periplasmic adaptor subunit [candidate division KSB1 bacterium]MDZ7365505.1 efflux RND transporter periplasmic adaptor subunit [candidate division KSB1 bacterium]MDZ7403608.1 efflux RND transporter periplasmic adaptor subunit [candidate division KSB1 bacterium]
MKKKSIITLVILATVLVAGYFLWPRQPAEKPMAAGMMQRTTAIKRGNLAAMVSATGKVEPIKKVEVKSKASGQIMTMPVEEGDRVKRGDLIARIDETDLRNAYEQAVADLDVAKATVAQTSSNVKRQTELFNRGLLSQAEIDQVKLEEVRAKAQLVKAETELATTEIRLKDAIVRSPIDGIILQKNVEAGQIISSGINSVSGGTLIATVANMDSVYVQAEVDEVDIGQVQIGQRAKVVADAFPDDVFYGKVLRVAPLATVEQNVTTFNVTIVVQNPGSKLKAGMNTTIDLTIADRRDIILAPKQAVKDFGEIAAQLAFMYSNDSTMSNRWGGRRPDSARGGMRPQFAGNGGGMPMFGRDGSASNGQSQSPRKFVLVKNDEGRFVPRRVQIGLSDFDYAEIISGLQEGDSVLVFSASRAGAARQEFMNRMRNMNTFGSTPRMGGGR